MNLGKTLARVAAAPTLFRNPQKAARMTHISTKCRQRKMRALKHLTPARAAHGTAIANLDKAAQLMAERVVEGVSQPGTAGIKDAEFIARLSMKVDLGRLGLQAALLGAEKAQAIGDVPGTIKACQTLLDLAVQAEVILTRAKQQAKDEAQAEVILTRAKQQQAKDEAERETKALADELAKADKAGNA